MRRLPVFFLIDVSESMVGDSIKNVNEGLHLIVTNLRSNPMALETAFISIIIFAGKAKTAVPLTEVISFSVPTLPIGGGTALGTGMNFLMDEISRQVQKTTYETKGDWKPIVFLFTDGAPTDDVTPAISRWKSDYKQKANLVAISIGSQADTTVLKKFTDQVIVFKDTDKSAYAEFFNWISASIESKSLNIAKSGDEVFELPELNQKILQKEDIFTPKSDHDERFAILLSRCQKTKKPYLIKYLRESLTKYRPEGAYPISEEYFSLSSEGGSPMISTEFLQELPMCPECGNTAVAYCSCRNLFCIGTEGMARCPWCERHVEIKISGGLDISKTQG